VSHLGPRLSALIDGELSHAQRERVLAHLARCAPCRSEAAALRVLKQRMHALGEATANTALTDRLVALGARGQAAGSIGLPRRRWPVRSLAVAVLAMAGLSVPAAAFMAGGGQAEPGPGVTPAIEEFMTQHELTTGNVPARSASASPSPSSTPRHHAGRHHRAALQPAGAR
jgi:anti-sigma factor RsiW